MSTDFEFKSKGSCLSFFIQLIHDEKFLKDWVTILKTKLSTNVFFECKSFNLESIDKYPFECSFSEIPIIHQLWKPKYKSFQYYFDQPENKTKNIVQFENLSKDCLLIVPKPFNDKNFANFTLFHKNAPNEIIEDLWKEIAITAIKLCQKRLDSPIWLNTSGLGISWLHIRFDKNPKYYLNKKYING